MRAGVAPPIAHGLDERQDEKLMSKRLKNWLQPRFWIALLLSGLLWITGGLSEARPALAVTMDQKIFMEAWHIVSQSYLDSTFNHQNWWRLRQQYLRQAFTDRDAVYDAIDEMLATLDDPFTRLLRPDQYRTLQVSTAGELSGVGLQIDIEPRSRQLRVVAPLAGSPAEAAGIKAGVYIVAIDGKPTALLSLDEAAMKMRGYRGTQVTLTLQDPTGGEPYDVALIRDRIALNPVDFQLDGRDRDFPIGYLRLSQFSANATEELAQAVHQLERQGAQGLILDLRNNPGGLLQAGIEVARLFINDEPIVYTVNRQGTLESFMAAHQAITAAPLVVLVNQGTASASEILAGALQDNGRAQLVGEQTFGKGLIQSLFELPDLSGLAVTVAKYETPKHHDIHKLGITPDRVVPQNPLRVNELTREKDKQYQVAIALLTQAG